MSPPALCSFTGLASQMLTHEDVVHLLRGACGVVLDCGSALALEVVADIEYSDVGILDPGYFGEALGEGGLGEEDRLEDGRD